MALLWTLAIFVRQVSAQPLLVPPSFVVILADDLGWTDTGVYGNRFHATPNIDRLAAQGMRFTNAHAASPVCSPTRASLLTGRYPARLGLTNIVQGIPPGNTPLLGADSLPALSRTEATLPQMLHAAGYVCATFGKWHLGGDRAHWPDRFGFDRSDPVSTRECIEKDSPPGLPGDFKSIGRLTDQACGFLTEMAAGDRPFFLYLAHYAVHLPIEARPELTEKYTRTIPPDEQLCRSPAYAGMVEELDAGVGRLLAQLDALGLREHTVVLFMSDNGGLLTTGAGRPVTTNAPLRDGKESLYEGGVREPMLVRWPGRIVAGTTSAAPVCSIDVLPTLLEMAGLPTPPDVTLDGLSLLPLLTGSAGATLGRDALFWHYPHYHHRPPASSVREGDLKLIRFYEDNRQELYDLAADPGEARDLAGRRPTETRRLGVKLDAWLRATNARLPRPNPRYRPWLAALKAGRQRAAAHWGFGLGAVAIIALGAGAWRQARNGGTPCAGSV